MKQSNKARTITFVYSFQYEAARDKDVVISALSSTKIVWGNAPFTVQNLNGLLYRKKFTSFERHMIILEIGVLMILLCRI